MIRKLSLEEQEDWLVLRNLNDRGELSSSDSFDLINNISLERKRASQEEEASRIRQAQNLEVQILNHSFDTENGVLTIAVNLTKSSETVFYSCNSDEETEERLESFIDLKEVIEKHETPVHNKLTLKFQRLDSSYLTSFAEWQKHFKSKDPKFNLRKQAPTLFEQFVFNLNQRNFTNGQCRTLGWCLFLNITESQLLGVEYKASLYLIGQNKVDPAVKKQINADLFRTFSELELKEFRTPSEGGNNPLYNVLMAFSLHCPDIGYSQGMNYLAAMILIGVEMKEVYAFTILVRLLRNVNEDDNFVLGSLYDKNLSGTLSLSASIEDWMRFAYP